LRCVGTLFPIVLLPTTLYVKDLQNRSVIKLINQAPSIFYLSIPILYLYPSIYLYLYVCIIYTYLSLYLSIYNIYLLDLFQAIDLSIDLVSKSNVSTCLSCRSFYAYFSMNKFSF
jgi:hypothetical protein